MFGTISRKTKQFFFVLIKLSLVVGAFYVIYDKLMRNHDLNFYDFTLYVMKNNQFSIKTISFLVVLSLLNWFFEILKWRVLISSFKTISFYKATEHGLSSLTASLLTPNRIGEYGVKALYFKPEERKRVVALNLLGNSLQMLVTILFGSMGLYVFLTSYETNLPYYKMVFFTAITGIIILLLLMFISKIRLKNKWFSIQKGLLYFKGLSSKIYSTVFLLAVLRYAIFSFQFYYILTLFGVPMSYINSLVVISSMYLLASIIPSIFVFDVLIKTGVGVYLFGVVGVNAFTVLCTILIMRLLNIVFPSFFGSIFVLKFKLPKP